MKQPIAIISTDRHLKESNALSLFDIAEQEIQLAQKLNVRRIIWLGDIFDSRLSQREELLTALTEIIVMYHEAGLQILCIPGNHDKTDYSADQSFLTSYKYHPGFILIETPQRLELDGVNMDFIPFYDQDVWLEKFKELPTQAGLYSILFSHTAVQGSINNDGSVVNNRIPTKLFNKYGKVFLGHYHNFQQPCSNVFHLPSVQQNNFGEDEEKGFTVLYNDLSFDIVKSNFVTYREVKVEVDKVTKSELLKLSKTPIEDVNFRITLVGDQTSVKAVNKKLFTDNGILVKTKYTDVEVPESEEVETVQELTGTNLAEKFKIFCDEKGYDYNEGFKLLKEVMKWTE